MIKTNDLNFIWVKHIIKELNDNGTVTQYVVIGKKNLDTGLFLVSPFSDFINTVSNKKTTTQIAYANVIVPFLNYVYANCQQKYSHLINNTNYMLDNLNVQMGIDFLNSCEVNPKTKVSYAKVLEKFYFFLQEKGFECFEHNNMPLFEGKYENTQQINNKDVLHNLKPEYIPLFINTAIEVTPDIALGVYLGCFGGLRHSEIVSIEYSNISFKCDKDGMQNMIITLADKDLRHDVEYAFISKCKRNRKQEILPVYGNLLTTLYKKHMKLYKKDGIDAVFIDCNGKPMTAQTYANKFAKLKKAFIRKLENSESIDARAYAITLKTFKWKTHICRGVFSNQIANSSNNIGEIALWRGDSNYTSALTYLNNKEDIGKSVVKTLDMLYTGGENYE